MSKSQACFKAGKYFLEGKEYKNAFSRLPLLADSKTKTIDLTIMFNYEDYIINEYNLVNEIIFNEQDNHIIIRFKNIIDIPDKYIANNCETIEKVLDESYLNLDNIDPTPEDDTDNPPPPPPVEFIVTTPVPPAGEIVTFVPATICVTPPPPPPGVAHVPSARKKFVVPPPLAGVAHSGAFAPEFTCNT